MHRREPGLRRLLLVFQVASRELARPDKALTGASRWSSTSRSFRAVVMPAARVEVAALRPRPCLALRLNINAEPIGGRQPGWPDATGGEWETGYGL